MTEVPHSEDPRIAGCCRKRAAVDLDFAELNPRIQGLMGGWTGAGVASRGQHFPQVKSQVVDNEENNEFELLFQKRIRLDR